MVKLSYNSGIFNLVGSTKTYSQLHQEAINSQQLLRYCDSMKDIKTSGSGVTDIISKAFGIKSIPGGWKSQLDGLKKRIIEQEKGFGNITEKSWLKTKERESLMISLGPDRGERCVFRESGKNLYFDFTDSDTVIEVSCFPNTINDSFFRSFINGRTEHFPPVDKTLQFDGSVMNDFLHFKNCINYQSECTREGNNSSGQKTYEYKYSIDYQIPTTIQTPYFSIGQTGTSPVSYPMPIHHNTDIHHIGHYVIGNENKKNTFQLTSKKDPGFTSSGLTEKQLFVHLKEMGDVMQVMAMLAWMLEKDKVEERHTFVMTTGDSVVFLLCILLKLPCILLEFETSKGDGKPRSRCLQRYLPVPLSVEDRVLAVKSEILTSNENLIGIISNINDTPVFTSATNTVNLTPLFLNNIIYKIKEINNELLSETNQIIADKNNPIYLNNFEIVLKYKYKIFELFYKNKVGGKQRIYALRHCVSYTDIQNFIEPSKKKFAEICQEHKNRFSGGGKKIKTNLILSGTEEDGKLDVEMDVETDFESEYKDAVETVKDDILAIVKQKVKKLPLFIEGKYNLAEYQEYMAYDIFIYCGNIFNIHNYVLYDNDLVNFITTVINYYENIEVERLIQEIGSSLQPSQTGISYMDKKFKSKSKTQKKRTIGISMNDKSMKKQRKTFKERLQWVAEQINRNQPSNTNIGVI